MNPTVLSLIGAAWWMAAIAILFGSAVLALLSPFAWRARGASAKTPPISVVVPVKEASSELEAALASLFSQSYPDFEVLVSATEESSPVIERARAVAARYPRIPSRFITRDPHAARNPKINNLALPIAQVNYDLIAVKDANIQLASGRLAEMARKFTGDTGLVVSVPIGMEPKNFPAEIECTAMNGYVARFLLAASALGLGFGIGATILFSRRDFERAGGIARVAQAVGEDHAISKMLAAIGRKTSIAGTVEQIIGRRRFTDIWNRQLRWAVCRRHEAPAVFYAELCASPFIAAVAGAVGANAIGIAAGIAFAGTIAAWIGTGALLALLKGWPLSWRSPLAELCFIFCFPILWLRARFIRRILWGDTLFTLPAPSGRKI